MLHLLILLLFVSDYLTQDGTRLVAALKLVWASGQLIVDAFLGAHCRRLVIHVVYRLLQLFRLPLGLDQLDLYQLILNEVFVALRDYLLGDLGRREGRLVEGGRRWQSVHALLSDVLAGTEVGHFETIATNCGCL